MDFTNVTYCLISVILIVIVSFKHYPLNICESLHQNKPINTTKKYLYKSFHKRDQKDINSICKYTLHLNFVLMK